MQTFHQFQNYLRTEVKGQRFEYEMSTIEEMCGFYMEERLSILKCGTRLLRGMMDGSYSYHKEAVNVVRQLLSERWMEEVKKQYEEATKRIVPRVRLSRSMSERWASQYVLEQAEILELVLHLHYDVVPRSMKEFVTWQAIFAKEAFGSRQINYSALNEEGQAHTRRIKYLSVLILIEMLDLEIFAGTEIFETLSEGVAQYKMNGTVKREFEEAKARIEALVEGERVMMNLGGIDAHGPLLLAWSAIISRVNQELASRGLVNLNASATSGSGGGSAMMMMLHGAASAQHLKASSPSPSSTTGPISANAADFSFMERLGAASEYGRRAVQLQAADWLLSVVQAEMGEAREGSLLAHRSVLAGWIVALTAAYCADELPFYLSLVQLHAEVYRDEPVLCAHFWTMFSQSPVWRALLDVATARFPYELRPLLTLLSALAADAHSAATVFFYLCDLPTYAQRLPAEAQGCVRVSKPPLPFFQPLASLSPSPSSYAHAVAANPALPLVDGALYAVASSPFDLDLTTVPLNAYGRVLSVDPSGAPSLIQWALPHSAWLLFVHYLDSCLNSLTSSLLTVTLATAELETLTSIVHLLAQLFALQPLMASSVHDHIIETELRLFGAPGAITAGIEAHTSGAALFLLPRLFHLLHLASSLPRPPLPLLTATLQCIKGMAFSHPQHVWTLFRRGLIEASSEDNPASFAAASIPFAASSLDSAAHASSSSSTANASSGPIRRVLASECALGTYPVTLAWLDLAECLVTFLQRWPANASQATVSASDAYDSLGFTGTMATPVTTTPHGARLHTALVLHAKPDASDFAPCLQYIQTALFAHYESWRYTTLQHKSEIGLRVLRIFERLLDDVPQPEPSIHPSSSSDADWQAEETRMREMDSLAEQQESLRRQMKEASSSPLSSRPFTPMTPLPRRTPAPAFSASQPRRSDFTSSTAKTPYSTTKEKAKRASSASSASLYSRSSASLLKESLFNSLLYDVSCHTNILNIVSIGPVALEYNQRRMKGGATLVRLLSSAFTVLETVLLIKQEAMALTAATTAGASSQESNAPNKSHAANLPLPISSQLASAPSFPSSSLHAHSMEVDGHPSLHMDAEEARVAASYAALAEITPLEASLLQRKVGKYSLDLVYIIASYISYNYDPQIPTKATHLLTILCQLSSLAPSSSLTAIDEGFIHQRRSHRSRGSKSSASGGMSVGGSAGADEGVSDKLPLSLHGIHFRSTPISLVSYFGSMADTLRAEFLWRLSDSREPSELRIAIWRLMTESLTSQPGLAELFINIQSDSVESINANENLTKGDEKMAAGGVATNKTSKGTPSTSSSSSSSSLGIPNSSVSVVLNLFMDDEQRMWYLKNDTRLMSEAFSFLTALWHVASDHHFVFSQIRSKPNFWLKLISCLSEPGRSQKGSEALSSVLPSASNHQDSQQKMEGATRGGSMNQRRGEESYRMLIDAYVFKIVTQEIFLVPRNGNLDEGLVVELGKLLTNEKRVARLLDEVTEMGGNGIPRNDANSLVKTPTVIEMSDARELLIKTLNWLNIEMEALVHFPSQRKFGAHFLFNTRLLKKKLGLSNRNTMSDYDDDALSGGGYHPNHVNGGEEEAPQTLSSSRFGLLSTLATLTAVDPISGQQIDVMDRIEHINMDLSLMEAKKEALRSFQHFLHLVLLRQPSLHIPELDTLLLLAQLLATKLGTERRESVASLHNVREMSLLLLLSIRTWTSQSLSHAKSSSNKSSGKAGTSGELTERSEKAVHSILSSVNDALFWLTSKSLAPSVCETLMTIIHLLLGHFAGWTDRMQEIAISISSTCVTLTLDAIAASPVISTQATPVSSDYNAASYMVVEGAEGESVQRKRANSSSSSAPSSSGSDPSSASSAAGASSTSTSSSSASPQEAEGGAKLAAFIATPIEERLFAHSLSILSLIASHAGTFPAGALLRSLTETNALGVLVGEVEAALARQVRSERTEAILSFFLSLASASPHLCEALVIYNIIQALRVEPWAVYVRTRMTAYGSNGERTTWHRVWSLSCALVTRLLHTLSLAHDTLNLSLEFLSAHASRFIHSLETHLSSFQPKPSFPLDSPSAGPPSASKTRQNSAAGHYSASSSLNAFAPLYARSSNPNPFSLPSSLHNTLPLHLHRPFEEPELYDGKKRRNHFSSSSSSSSSYASLLSSSPPSSSPSSVSASSASSLSAPSSSSSSSSSPSSSAFITLASLEETERVTALLYELAQYRGRWQLALENSAEYLGGAGRNGNMKMADALEHHIFYLFQRVSLLISHHSDIVSGSKAVSQQERKSLASSMAKAKEEKKKQGDNNTSSSKPADASSNKNEKAEDAPAGAKKVSFAPLPKIGAIPESKPAPSDSKTPASSSSDSSKEATNASEATSGSGKKEEKEGDASSSSSSSSAAKLSAPTPGLSRSLAMSQMIGKGEDDVKKDESERSKSLPTTSTSGTANSSSSSSGSSPSSGSSSSSSKSKEIPFLERIELYLFRILRNTISIMRMFGPRVFSSPLSSSSSMMSASSSQSSSYSNPDQPILVPATEATMGGWPTMGLVSLLVTSCASSSKRIASSSSPSSSSSIPPRLPPHQAEELRLCAFIIETAVLLLTSHIHLYVDPRNPDELIRRRVRDEIGYELESTLSRLLKDWRRFGDTSFSSSSSSSLSPSTPLPPFLLYAQHYLQSLQRR